KARPLSLCPTSSGCWSIKAPALGSTWASAGDCWQQQQQVAASAFGFTGAPPPPTSSQSPWYGSTPRTRAGRAPSVFWLPKLYRFAGRIRLWPRLVAEPAAELSSHEPWVVAPIDACKYVLTSPAIVVAFGLLKNLTENTLSSPLL